MRYVLDVLFIWGGCGDVVNMLYAIVHISILYVLSLCGVFCGAALKADSLSENWGDVKWG